MHVTCTKRLEFDYGHRLLNHESLCAHLHGHRGAVEVTCSAQHLDHVGRVVDFGVIKQRVGKWLDENFDHAFLVNGCDDALLIWLEENKQRHYVVAGEPSAENIAAIIASRANELLADTGVVVTRVRFFETPTSWAEWQA